jgi:Cytochrome C oxidase, cbb3-type, subunit III
MNRHFGFFMASGSALFLAGLLAGCDNLAKGTKVKPFAESSYFADGNSSRLPPPNSIARGHLQTDVLLYAGRDPDGKPASQFPWPINEDVLARGKQRYEIVCASCHGPDGYGRGIIVRRGFPQPPSYHDDALRKASVGHFFDVITNGYGAMYPYASIVEVNDRWAIIAYIRALQRSQHASIGDVPPAELLDLGKEGK